MVINSINSNVTETCKRNCITNCDDNIVSNITNAKNTIININNSMNTSDFKEYDQNEEENLLTQGLIELMMEAENLDTACKCTV